VTDRASFTRQWLPVMVLCLVQFVDVMGVTVVTAALPDMLADVGGSSADGTLVATGYAMFFGGLLLLGARLGDRFGHRRLIVVGLILFAGGSVVAATAPSVALLTAGRSLQGAAAAASVPSALRTLTALAGDGRLRDRAVALWSAGGAAAGAAGLVVGGVVTHIASWRAVFWAFLAVAALLALAMVRTVPVDTAIDRSVRLSAPSAITFTMSVMGFVVGTSLIPHSRSATAGALLLAAAVVAAIGFVALDRRAPMPLAPKHILRRPVLRQGSVSGALNTATTSSTVTLATLYLQDSRGESSLAAGLLLLPFSLAVILGAVVAAPMLGRWQAQRVVAIGLSLVATFDAVLILVATTTWALSASMVLGGVGLGLSSVASTTLGTRVPIDERGVAAGVINTAAQVGTALGIAIVLLVVTLTTGAPAPESAIPAAGWGTGALVAALGALAFLAVARPADDGRTATLFSAGRGTNPGQRRSRR
jgi:MFS family permease